jgi:hypothetical protein
MCNVFAPIFSYSHVLSSNLCTDNECYFVSLGFSQLLHVKGRKVL